MIPLSVKGRPLNINQTIVGIFRRSSIDDTIGYVLKDTNILCELIVKNSYTNSTNRNISSYIYDIPSLNHLSDGDIIAANESGLINTLFRKGSYHNSLFITDRCNSNCLMCSQPPKNIDDLDYFYNVNKALIQLIPKETEVIGITGGEPTILGGRLLELLILMSTELPNMCIHMLSNGRIFSRKKYAANISSTNKNLIIGVPIYSDNYLDHDYIVQARDAFNQTIIGLHNLARYGVKIEIRIVMHKLTYQRLPQIAKFIYKNLPFVNNIAFMGLEYTGYTPFNHDKLWIEPSKYMNQLEEAVLYLNSMGMNAAIYNLQHCLLKETLWNFSVKSISDWKRNYIDECTKCDLLDKCGGVFATSKMLSSEIKAITTQVSNLW